VFTTLGPPTAGIRRLKSGRKARPSEAVSRILCANTMEIMVNKVAKSQQFFFFVPSPLHTVDYSPTPHSRSLDVSSSQFHLISIARSPHPVGIPNRVRRLGIRTRSACWEVLGMTLSTPKIIQRVRSSTRRALFMILLPASSSFDTKQKTAALFLVCA
jgi:hypothetical protein